MSHSLGWFLEWVGPVLFQKQDSDNFLKWRPTPSAITGPPSRIEHLTNECPVWGIIVCNQHQSMSCYPIIWAVLRRGHANISIAFAWFGMLVNVYKPSKKNARVVIENVMLEVSSECSLKRNIIHLAARSRTGDFYLWHFCERFRLTLNNKVITYKSFHFSKKKRKITHTNKNNNTTQHFSSCCSSTAAQ